MERDRLVDLELHAHRLVLERDLGDRALPHAAHGHRIALGQIPDLLESGRVERLLLPQPVVLQPGNPDEQEQEAKETRESDLRGGAARCAIHPGPSR